MTNRKKFIEEISIILYAKGNDPSEVLSDEALAYWNELVKGKASVGGMTETGEKVLTWMLENEKEYSNIFNAKIIGEGLFVASRVVAGAMRKLVADGYVERSGQNPVSYSLTDTARSWQN